MGHVHPERRAGEEITYENYQSFYQLLLSVAVLSTKEATMTRNPRCCGVEYQYFDGSEPDVIGVLPRGGRGCPLRGRAQRRL